MIPKDIDLYTLLMASTAQVFLEGISVNVVREHEHVVRTRRLVMPFGALGKSGGDENALHYAFCGNKTTAKASKRSIPQNLLFQIMQIENTAMDQ